jgi:hypothetical protein
MVGDSHIGIHPWPRTYEWNGVGIFLFRMNIQWAIGASGFFASYYITAGG